MKSVWTRGGAGTAALFVRSPVPSFPNIHLMTLPTPLEFGRVQVYLVEAEPLTLIDTGVDSPDCRLALESALEGLGHDLSEIERIVLTHAHSDHMGQAESLRQRSDGLEVWAHEDAAPRVEHYSRESELDLDGLASLFREFGMPGDELARVEAQWRDALRAEPDFCGPTAVDRRLRHADAVPFKGFDLQVIHAPGHTAGHILLLHPKSGALVSGDHIMGDAAPNTENYYLPGLPSPDDPLRRRPRFKGLLLYRNSLRQLRRSSFRTLLPARGGVVEHADRVIRETLLYYDVRIQRIERSLKSVHALGQSVTAYELCRGLFPGDDSVDQARARFLTGLGALDVLEASGACVTSRRDDGAFLHTPPDRRCDGLAAPAGLSAAPPPRLMPRGLPLDEWPYVADT